jgi:hypothetical protein
MPPSPPDPPVESEGISLVREDAAAASLRRRLERPARLGLYVLATPGAVTAAAGTALWLSSSSLLGVALATFGGVLVALGIAQLYLLRRDLEHWPDGALLWEEGVELVLHNGEVRGASWTDPDLALNLVARRAPLPADREYLLLWMSEGRIPSVELSEEGFARLRQAAVTHELTVTEHRRGRVSDGTQWIEIRSSMAAQLAAPRGRSSDQPAP